MTSLSEPAKLLLLITLLAKDEIISNNGKAYIKELILRRDPRLVNLLASFEQRDSVDLQFLETVHALIGQEAQALYDDLFSDTSLDKGKTLSKQEREELDLQHEKSLIYGEVEFDSFYRILRKIAPKRGGVFYDLGSGTGKALFVARLTRDFKKCVGIEILESLHREAVKVVKKFNEQIKPMLFLGDEQEVVVQHGSFLDVDWSDADLVFANSTCFSDELLATVAQKARSLSPGTIIVTFTKGLNDERHFEVLLRQRYRMSWGPATVFVHRRTRHPDPSGSLPPYRLNFLPSDSDAYFEEESSPVSRFTSAAHYSCADIDEGVFQGGADEEETEEEEEEEQEERQERREVATPPRTSSDAPPPPPSTSSSLSAQFRETLGSPQDTALLQRKRQHSSPSHLLSSPNSTSSGAQPGSATKRSPL